MSYAIMDRLALDIYYRYSQNDSSGGNGVTFARNLFGASISYSF
jgi:opacity protein-like surface antigen